MLGVGTQADQHDRPRRRPGSPDDRQHQRGLRQSHLLQRLQRHRPRTRPRHLRPAPGNRHRSRSTTTSSSTSSATASTPTPKAATSTTSTSRETRPSTTAASPRTDGPPTSWSEACSVATSPKLINNYTYNSDHDGANNLGYSAGCTNPTLTGNYFDSGTALTMNNCTGVTMTGNTFYGSIVGFTQGQFPNNTYYSSRPTGIEDLRPPQCLRGRPRQHHHLQLGSEEHGQRRRERHPDLRPGIRSPQCRGLLRRSRS